MNNYYQLQLEDILFPDRKYPVRPIKAHPGSPCDLYYCPVCGSFVASAVENEFQALRHECRNGHRIDFSEVPYYTKENSHEDI